MEQIFLGFMMMCVQQAPAMQQGCQERLVKCYVQYNKESFSREAWGFAQKCSPVVHQK